jgi:predicted dehydrogenase
MTGDIFPEARVPPLRGGPVLRWGILAPGGIADYFAATVHANTDQRITRVASRSPERSAAFATRHGIDRVAPTYEALVEDLEVDIVYVAAPHSEHHRLALMAIAAGKHVLIEKPIAISASQAREISSAADAARVMAAEAMWTRYLPQFDVVRQLLERGDLGTVRLATADVGWQMGPDAPTRFFDPAQGGGAALDMGVYGYWFVQFAIGAAQDVRAVGTMTDTGVDDQSVVAIAGSEGRHASVTTSMSVTNSGLATIHGTEGNIRFIDPFVFPARFQLVRGSDSHTWSDDSSLTMRDGLAWQTTALATYVTEGHTDSPIHPIADAIAVMEVIDDVRAQLRHASQGRTKTAIDPR